MQLTMMSLLGRCECQDEDMMWWAERFVTEDSTTVGSFHSNCHRYL